MGISAPPKPRPNPVAGTATTPTTVANAMTTNVVTILPGSTVADAVHLFVKHSFRHLIVAENGKLRGVLSDRDALRHMARGGSAQTGTVNGIMKTDPITAGPETSLRDAAELMRRHRINCLPVVDASAAVLGIVTTTDLLGTLTQLLDAARRPS